MESEELNPAIRPLNNLNIEPTKPPMNRMHAYENVPQRRLSNNYTEYAGSSDYGSSTLQSTDRPMSLPFERHGSSKLRSSLKKHSGGLAKSAVTPTTTKTGFTPTNQTPPDSLTSDDSSYLSAREGSISSQSRVRFSPEALLEQGESEQRVIDAATGAIAQQQPYRRVSRTRIGSGSDILNPLPHS